MAKAAWYVTHTYSGHENKVKTNLAKRVKAFNLKGQIEEVLIPTQQTIEIKDGKKREIQQRIFPGYVLIKMVMSDDAYSCIRHTPGVTGFVGVGNKPSPLNEKEVRAIKAFAEQKAPKLKAEFKVGEAVKIIEGPFTDFIGSVESMNEAQGKLTVLVSIFGRETPVELNFLQITRL